MEPTRLFELLAYQQQNYPQQVAVAKKQQGAWVTYSINDVIDLVNNTSLGLLKMGVQKDDKIAIISTNCPEWNFVDFGVQQLGAVTVPMYPTITEKDYRFIFEDAEVKYVFVEDKDLYDKVQRATEGISGIEKVFTFDKVEGAPHWSEVHKLGEGGNVADLEPLKEAVQPQDLLTLIYTSGTTGNPKGVMLTHDNIMSNAKAVGKVFPGQIEGKNILSFLPICHIFERTAVYTYYYSGCNIYYAESLETISDNMKEVKPEFFAAVPRLLEKVYDKIITKGHELSGIKKSLFFWAVNLGHKFDLPKHNGGPLYNMKLNLARKIIFSKWQEALGGKVQFIVSGGAALQPRLARIFWAADIRILEAYGLTETSPGISFSRNSPEGTRLGCVGAALEGVEFKIADDGEVLVKGPNVMKGYYKRPDLTAEVLKDGWFHTGDIGEIVEGKFLKITDRKKEMFKTSGGKYVAPQLLENKIKESMVIEQVMVIGDGRRFPGALVVPNFEALADWCGIHGIQYTSDTEMIKNAKVIEKFDREIATANESFAKWEKVKQYRLIPDQFTVEKGEMTAKLSLRRKIILDHYNDLIEEIYATEAAMA